MELANAAHGRFQEVSWEKITGSTNADLVERARTHPSEAAVAFTDEQTAGRGRRDRRWDMVSGGGLLVSFFVPWSPADDAHAVPTALAVAAIEAISQHGREVALKWPNDIVTLDDRKVGGMLSEAVTVDGQFIGVVAGLGCNVSWPDRDARLHLPDAANLDELGAGPVDRSSLARALIRSFDEELDGVRASGVQHLHDRYRERCTTIGTTVRVEQAHGTVIGEATDLSPDGALIIVVDGVQRRIDVGDVVHLRPHDLRGRKHLAD